MSKKILTVLGIGVAAYAAFGVGVLLYYPDKPATMTWEDRQDFNKIQIDKLHGKTGPKKFNHEEIIALLGGPDISEAKMSGKDKIQVMYYRTQHKRPDGITSADECTPLLFKNDQLVALGDKAEQQFENDY